MIYGFFGRISSVDQLKEALDAGSRQTRLIADRVAKATLQNADGFAIPDAQGGQAAQAADGGVDVEQEMVNLADQQIRFEATARLLQKAYEQVRLSLRER